MKKGHEKKGKNLWKDAVTGLAMMTTAFMLFSSCETFADDGRKAGKDFCDCVNYHSEDYCLDELRDNYSNSTYTSVEFIKEFNNTNPCGAVLERVTYSKAIPGKGEIESNLLIIKKKE